MELNILKQDGTSSGLTVSLSPAIFGVEVSETAIFEAVRQYLAHQRQGTHKTKGRSEVSRTSKKAFRQKGTGGARRGSYRSPIVKGGGTVFGPQPRLYTVGMSKKLKTLAKNSAFTLKAQNEALFVVEDISFEQPSTKNFKSVLSALSLSDKKVLMVTEGVEKDLYLSSRNLPKASVKPLNELNTYSIINADVIVFTSSALAKLQESVQEAA
jgi:large subunit ribosomal protein L4